MNQPQKSVLFYEEQRFRQWWLWLVIIIPFFATLFGVSMDLLRTEDANQAAEKAIALVAVIVIWIVIGFVVWWIRMLTVVRADGLYIKFLPFIWKEKKIDLDEFNAMRAGQYRPLVEYGGWGIRYGWKRKAYNVMGNQGVELHRPDKSILLIGSQRPRELAEAIASISHLESA